MKSSGAPMQAIGNHLNVVQNTVEMHQCNKICSHPHANTLALLPTTRSTRESGYHILWTIAICVVPQAGFSCLYKKCVSITSFKLGGPPSQPCIMIIITGCYCVSSSTGLSLCGNVAWYLSTQVKGWPLRVLEAIRRCAGPW